MTLRTTQSLQFVNKDPMGHNPKLNPVENAAVCALLPPTVDVTHHLAVSEPIPVSANCNIDPWMRGWLIVQDHPYMAVSDADGKFTIKNLPVGAATFRIWHEQAGFVRTIKRDEKTIALAKGKLAQTIRAGDNDLGQIRISRELIKR